ncbi:glycosyltransferase [uncultured Winogradskyella sp.]|uniref:glycosyltransferase n=1 Tax=uncultured Winogradskyella sp. TaxID=395353 RepID=UPI0026340E72|nr:glycosyltransferase [uncultured Winogradskyella sp.]
MTLAIITSAPHKVKDGKYYSYGPYVREMNIWTKYADKTLVIGPRDENNEIGEIDEPYNQSINYTEVKAFNITSVYNILRTLVLFPFTSFKIYKVMKKADHIHLRCPCNMSLLGAFVQILFPSKRKTVKYAGNWDYDSKQPWAYRMQQNILKNTLLSKNIKVLVYGEWKDATTNMVSFISATYRNDERVSFSKKDYSKKLKFVFTANLVVGKRPLLTIKIIESLRKKGIDAEIHMFGDGPLMDEAMLFIKDNNLSDSVFMLGNQDRETIKTCLQDAHFSILPSKSEGWPKAIAEGMFFGAIPISTKISCLSWMLDYGKRGILIENDLDSAVNTILKHIGKGDDFLNEMSKAAMSWSQIYTLNKLDEEIGKMVVK